MKISAALIMKNEEDNLPRLLKSLQGKFDEIVVVDTGSEDRSVEIAKSFGCKVFQKEWNGFADARNFAIQKCSGDWIWHFDADFELEDSEFDKFKKYFALLADKERAFMINVKNYNAMGEVGSISSQTFIHKNDPSIKWIGNIHEQINLPTVYRLPIFINHFGYQYTSVQKSKAKRNLELIIKDLELFKNDPDERLKKLFYLLQTYAILSFFDELPSDWQNRIAEYLQAREHKRKTAKSNFFVQYGLVYIAQLYLHRKMYQEVVDTLQLADEPASDLLLKVAKAYEKLGDEEQARSTYIDYLLSVSRAQKSKDILVIDTLSDLPDLLYKKLPQLFEKKLEDFHSIWCKNKDALYIGLLYAKVLEQRDMKKSEKLLVKLARRYEDPLAMQFLCQHYYQKKEFDKALQWSNKILQKNQHHVYANRLNAIVYRQRGEIIKALNYASNIVKVSPNQEHLQLFIELLMEGGFEKEAATFMKRLKNLS